MNKHVMEIGIEIEGLEQLQELAEEMAELEMESTVFECQIAEMKFKGTKSDFEAFVDGAIRMMEFGKLIG